METQKIKRLKAFCLAAGAVLFISLYCYGAFQNATIINLDVSRVDQGAYLSYAENLYETNYNYVGGRNRMPIYPFLLSLLHNPNLTETQLFTRGKYFNIALSATLLPALFYLFKRRLPWLQAIALWLITTFTVFVFKAGYVQVELLFYFLMFCSFLLLCEMLKSPSWKLGILTGIVVGITHLTKASVSLGLLLFVGFALLKEVYSIAVWLKSDAKDRSLSHFLKQAIAPRLVSVALVILCFLGTVFPYISTSQKFFGQYFYNVNSTFYIWYDTWEEAEAGTRLYGDSKGWPEMPPELIPSASKYFREHTTEQVIDRLRNGLDKLYIVAESAYGYFKYALIYFAIALLATVLNWRHSLALFKKHAFLALFLVTYFVLHLLLYAWYAPIGDGNRFTLSLFLPFMFFLASILNVQALKQPVLQLFQFKFNWLHLFSLLILGMIMFELPSILLDRIYTTFAAT